MMGKPAIRADGGLVVRAYEGKSVKVSVLLRPEDARRLRLAAVGLDVDLGDLVTLALEPVLKQIETVVRVRGGVQPATINGTDVDGPPAAPVGDTGPATVRMVG